jgi:hypothetical protein
LDLSSPHRVPLTWLLQHGSESIRLRTLLEFKPPAAADLEALSRAVLTSPVVQAVTSRQAEDGSWGENILGTRASARDGFKDVGTVAQYRRLIQLAYPRTARSFKLADRLLFRLLSRDQDPALLFEFQKAARDVSDDMAEWLRNLHREAATAALAEAGYMEDPRIRGSAHRVASAVSAFLRSPLADNPFQRSGGVTILNPEAHPPSWYSLAMVAAMPNLRRERAGFTERLGQYLSFHATRRAYVIKLGRRTLKPTHVLLGDPVETDAKGNCKDIPLALHFFELLGQIGALESSPSARKVLTRLYGECDDRGVWHPKKLASPPRATNPASYHFYPLVEDTKTPEGRVVDVTFRLARIAKLAGRQLEYS